MCLYFFLNTDLSSLSLQPSASSSNAMVKDEYMNRSMDVDAGHQSVNMGMATPAVSGVPPLMPAPHQAAPQAAQHHGPPPTPTFSSMMSHASQNQGQSELFSLG